MARPRLNPERPLTSTERWRRHRDRKRGLDVPPAPGRPQPSCGTLSGLLSADDMGVLTWDELTAALSAPSRDENAV
jgi:hypothetical protein